jgi:tRNA threonylcarbamoyladenosine biosynthesis protein TsaB
MIGLGIDTSTKVGALTLVQDQRLLIEQTIDAKLNHSARLLPTLEAALDKTGLSREDLCCVGIGVGPGSLTGIRVGIAFAKGLVFALGKPLVGVCSLKAIAHQRKDHPGVLSVIVDGKMGGFYHAAYKWRESQIEEISPVSIFGADDLIRNLPLEALILSPDADRLPGNLVERFPAGCSLEPTPLYPRAEYIACRAVEKVTGGKHDPEEKIEPIYLRPGIPGKARLS